MTKEVQSLVIGKINNIKQLGENKMRMSNWTKMLKGDMTGLKKEEKKVVIPENAVYRVKWASGHETGLVDHDEAISRINEWMNRTNWEWMRVVNTENKQQQIVYEPKSASNRGFLHLKKLNENMLVEGKPPKGTLYINKSSIFDRPANKYDIKLFTNILKKAGAKKVWTDNSFGWDNQPEVVLFSGLSKRDAEKALEELPLFKKWGTTIWDASEDWT